MHSYCYDCGRVTCSTVYSADPVFCTKCASDQKKKDALKTLIQKATAAAELLEAEGYGYSASGLQLAVDQVTMLD